MKKNRIICIIISVFCMGLVFATWKSGFLNTLEYKLYDLKFIVRGPKDVSRDIVIVGIDEDSLARFGQFPWPREIYAKSIDNLCAAGVKVIGMDILFPEPQNQTYDKLLSLSLKNAFVVGAAYFDNVIENVLQIINGSPQIVPMPKIKLTEPIEILKDSYKLLGLTNSYPDSDGILRSARIVYEYEGKKYFSLNAQLAASFLDRKPEDFGEEMLYVNYRKGGRGYIKYSFNLIYDAAFPKEWVKDKIVIMGSTAVGAFDHYPMPYDHLYPGVEFQATVIDNLLNGDYIRQSPEFIIIILIILLGVIEGNLFLKMKQWHGMVLLVFTIVAYFFICQFLFNKYNFNLDTLKPSMSIMFSYLGIMTYRFRTEEREKRWIKKTFSYYLNPEVIKELADNPEKLRLGGERKNLTVLFSDIVGFTTLSEKLPPEETVSLLNEYLSAMTEIVFKHAGTLDKFIGDAIMCFWGAPVPQENHAERAVLCAVEMVEGLEELRKKWEKENRHLIDIGIGINSGECVVGNFGSAQRMDYTVMGDTVNLTSRIEGLTRDYKTRIIISEVTYELVRNIVETKPLGEVKVKGKEKSVNIFEVLGRKKLGSL